MKARRRPRLALLTALALIHALAVAGTAGAGPGGPPPSAALLEALRAPGLPPARTGAIAIDLRSGETLFAVHPDRALIPASNEKLAVTFAALERLGPAFRFRTDVVGVGHRKGPAWVGNLVLKGYGDPTFDTPKLTRLVAILRGRGIRLVRGSVKGDESFFDTTRDAPGWKRDYLGDESPPLSALALDRARGWPAQAPAISAATAFRTALEQAGITVIGNVEEVALPTGGDVLASVESAPLRDIARLANADSDNFVAEMILKQLGALEAEIGTTAAGANAVLDVLEQAGIPTSGVRIVDGSGLSRLDRLTPRALVSILRAALQTPGIGPAFRESLAVAGRAGTLETRLRGLGGVVRGKTGTTDLASVLTGTVSGTIAFAVVENGFPVPTATARATQDRFAAELAAWLG